MSVTFLHPVVLSMNPLVTHQMKNFHRFVFLGGRGRGRQIGRVGFRSDFLFVFQRTIEMFFGKITIVHKNMNMSQYLKKILVQKKSCPEICVAEQLFLILIMACKAWRGLRLSNKKKGQLNNITC